MLTIRHQARRLRGSIISFMISFRRGQLLHYLLLGMIAASSVLNFYLLLEVADIYVEDNFLSLVKHVDSPYTSEALQRNPYLGWQPPFMQQLNDNNGTATNFSWADCFSKTEEYTGKAPYKDGGNQPLGCLERPSQLGKDSFSLEMFNETSWIPDVTMLRTMLIYGKDRDGHIYPAQLPKELCRDIIISSENNFTIDEDKRCFREAKIKPTGPLNASTVTISPWNHFGVSHSVPDENKTSITVPAPKVLCLIYTVKNSHSTSIRAIRDTWGGGCDGFLAFSSSPDPRLPAIALQHDGPESYDNMWQKVRKIWKYVGTHYLNEFDWFFIGKSHY